MLESTASIRFAGQIAIVTGAHHGIGRAIAHNLAAGGARVAACDIATPTHNPASGQPGIWRVQKDLSDPASIQELVDEVRDRFGAVSILINNAATVLRAPIEETSLTAWRRVFAVNVDSALMMARAVFEDMREVGGTIVNITSISGTVATEPGLAAYGSSKAALDALTKSISIEWGPYNIRCNAVSPGFVRTEATKAAYADAEVLQARTRAVPLRRITTAEEVADVVAFLCSSESSAISGASIVVDGGLVNNLFGQVPGRMIISAQ